MIRATWTQQPFPANVLYRLARRHVAAAGVYLRLHPIPRGNAASDAGPGTAAEPGDSEPHDRSSAAIDETPST